MLKNIKIQTKVFCMILIVSIISILIAVGIIGSGTKKNTLELIKNQNVTIVKNFSELISERVNSALAAMGHIELSKDFTEAYKSRSTAEYINSKVKLCKLFQEQRMLNNELIKNILFVRDDETVFYEYSAEYLNQNCDVSKDEAIVHAKNEKGYIIWYPGYRGNILKSQADDSAATIAKYIYDNNEKPVGVLLVNLRASFFQNQFLKILNHDIDGYFYVADKENNIISEFGSKPKGFLPEYFPDKGNCFEKNDLIVTSANIATNDWKIVTVIERNRLLKSKDTILRTIALAIALSLLIAVICALIFSYMFSKPLKRLSKSMRDVEKGDLELRVNVSDNRTDEIGIIYSRFNHMLDSIEKLMTQIKTEQEESYKANIRVLEEQLNSHFLFNVLDSIYFLCEMGEAKKAAEMTVSLADFIRHVLNRGGQITTIEQEIKNLLNYASIERIYHEKKFDFEYEVDSSLLEKPIVKLIILPLVENSLIHGIMDTDNGKIMLEVFSKDDMLHFKVTDNGKGMSAEQLERLNDILNQNTREICKKSGYGLQNLRNRLLLYYGAGISIRFSCVSSGGCSVEVVIPFDSEHFEHDC